MAIFIVKDGNQIYRVRKEDVGCSVFCNESYIEANDSIYNMLYIISEKGVKSYLDEVFNLYNEERNIITNDLLEIAYSFIESAIFIEIANELIKTLKNAEEAGL